MPSFQKMFGQNWNVVMKSTKKKWVAELLANEQMVRLLLVHLQSKEVDNKKRIVEKIRK